MFGSRFISIRAVYEFDVRDDVSHRLHSRLIVGDVSLNWVYHLERWFARCFRRVWVGSVAAIFFLGKPWRLFGYSFVARPLPLPPRLIICCRVLRIGPEETTKMLGTFIDSAGWRKGAGSLRALGQCTAVTCDMGSWAHVGCSHCMLNSRLEQAEGRCHATGRIIFYEAPEALMKWNCASWIRVSESTCIQHQRRLTNVLCRCL